MESGTLLSPPLCSPSLSSSISGAGFVVTGGTQGLGLGIAKTLKSLGAKGLVLVSRTPVSAQVQEELTDASCTCYWVQADLSQAQEASEVIGKAVACLSGDADDQNNRIPLRGVVNAAATTARGNLESTLATDFDLQMAINVRAPFLITQAAARVMDPGSSIVNIASCAAHGGAPFVMAYSCSKAALVTLTKNNAAELAPKGIRVNAINMGWTVTDNEHKIQCVEHKAGQDWMEAADASCPLGRILRPPDVAATVAFLLSDASAMMTGSIVDLHPEFPNGMLSTSSVARE